MGEPIRIGKGTIEVVVGDITTLAVDAVVNPANASLMGGGGVDGAIHRAGGYAVLEECKKIRMDKYPKGLPTGKAVITTGGDLPAKHVIHTVGPVHASDPDPAGSLRACYLNSLLLARDTNLTSVAFPAISTGAYGYPKAAAAAVAVRAIDEFFSRDSGSMRRVLLVAWDETDGALLESALTEGRQG